MRVGIHWLHHNHLSVLLAWLTIEINLHAGVALERLNGFEAKKGARQLGDAKEHRDDDAKSEEPSVQAANDFGVGITILFRAKAFEIVAKSRIPVIRIPLFLDEVWAAMQRAHILANCCLRCKFPALLRVLTRSAA